MEVFSLFCSRSIREHVIRGFLAVVAIWAAIRFEHLVWPLFIFLPAAFFFMRGCPACWALGFYETVKNKFDKPEKPPSDWMKLAYGAVQKKCNGKCAIAREQNHGS